MILLLLILGYVLIGGMVFGFISNSKLIAKYNDDPEFCGVIIGTGWPILFGIIPLVLSAYIGYKISTSIINKWDTH